VSFIGFPSITVTDAAAAELVEKAARNVGDTAYRFPIGLRMYDLQHAANTLLSYAGVPLEVARERMGHASIRLTADTYGHLYPSMQADVAKRLERPFDDIQQAQCCTNCCTAQITPVWRQRKTPQRAVLRGFLLAPDAGLEPATR